MRIAKKESEGADLGGSRSRGTKREWEGEGEPQG